MRVERSPWLKEVRVYPARKPSLQERNAWYDRGFLWSGQYFYAPDTAANVAKAQASIGAIHDSTPPGREECRDGKYTDSAAAGRCSQHGGTRNARARRCEPCQTEAPQDCFSQLMPVADIKADPERFQGREAHFSEESVQRILADYDPRRMDPITVWKEPRTGRYYVLSGHSRLEAHRRLKLSKIPVKEFLGSEVEAVAFSKGYANRLATVESLAEDVQTYRLMRDGDLARGMSPLDRKTLRHMFARADKLELLSWLSPRGKFMDLMRQPVEVQKQFPYLETKAAWVGELRQRYPDRLTNAHEDELFQYFLTTPRTLQLTKEDFFALVQKKLDSLLFDPTRPLALNVQTTETETRADTGPSQRRIYEIDRELLKLTDRLRAARTKAEKDQLSREVLELREERSRLEKGIATALRTQSALFGPPPELEFDWDEGNRLKSWLKHDVAQQEAESIFYYPGRINVKEPQPRKGEQYYIAYGISYNGTGRWLRVTYCIRHGKKIRIVSARPPKRRERTEAGIPLSTEDV